MGENGVLGGRTTKVVAMDIDAMEVEAPDEAPDDDDRVVPKMARAARK